MVSVPSGVWSVGSVPLGFLADVSFLDPIKEKETPSATGKHWTSLGQKLGKEILAFGEVDVHEFDTIFIPELVSGGLIS